MSLNPRVGTLAFLACAQAFAGCASEKADPLGSVAPAAVREADATVVVARMGAETRLRIGQVMAFELYGNASTGYGWEVVEDGSPVLVPAEVPPETSPARPPMLGAGGPVRWRYRALQRGAASVRLVYRRAWEQDIAPVRTVVFPVLVE